MANTYYNSQLTAEEIEDALEAINGVIAPANNGKVLVVDNGKIVPKSVTDYIDLNLQAKTATPNASQQVVAPDSGYDGLSAVTIEGVIAPNLIAENIKKDVVVKVGTATDDDSVKSVTGSYEGVVPTGTINIFQNGVIDVTNYANANVNVSGGGGSVYAFAEVHYISGNICTATDGVTTLTAPDTSGVWIVAIPNSGTWTFSMSTSPIISTPYVFNVYGERGVVAIGARYYESSDGKLGVAVFEDYVVWFFMNQQIDQNLTINSIPENMRPYLPAQGANIMAKAYSSDASTSWIGNVGAGYFYEGFRLLSISNGNYINASIWATLEVPAQDGTPILNISGGSVQDVIYENVEDYIESHQP